MTPGQKYSVKITDAELDSFKETFMMFDKVVIFFSFLNLYFYNWRMAMELFQLKS